MEKKILLWLLTAIAISVFLSFDLASAANQQVSVVVKPGMGDIDIFSPIQGKVYQINNIPININVTTKNNKVKQIFLLEGQKSNLLCSNCNNYSDYLFLSNGNHTLIFNVSFYSGLTIARQADFKVDAKSKIYFNESNIISLANSDDIVNYLFYHNFTIEYKEGIIPSDKCSVRASGSTVYFNQNFFSNTSDLNFYYSSAGKRQGSGTITSQNKKDRFSVKFKIVDVLEKTNSNIIFKAEGSVNYNKKSIKDQNFTLAINEDSYTASINSTNFSINGMAFDFVEGCFGNKKVYYLINDKGRLSSMRGISDVRKILADNPIFIENFERLKMLFEFYWRMIFL